MGRWEYRSTHSSCWHCVKVTEAACSVHFTSWEISPPCPFNRGLGGPLTWSALYIYIYIYIYIACHHSAMEHRASTRILHPTLFLASVLICAQVFLTPLASSSTVLHHVFLGLPCPVCLGDSTLGLAWLCRRMVFAVYGPAITTCVSWSANLFGVASRASTALYSLSGVHNGEEKTVLPLLAATFSQSYSL